MEFDKSKVYTALNADELKVGSKVIIADTLECLKSRVRENDTSNYSGRLLSVFPEDCQYRFQFEDENKYALAYLVEEPEEKKLKWTDLKVGDVIKEGSATVMVTIVDSSDYDCHIFAGCEWYSDKMLEKLEKVN